VKTTQKPPTYIYWRHKSVKPHSEGGPRRAHHLTHPQPGNGEAPYTLCGLKIPGYSTTPGEELSDDWQDYCYIPDGEFHLCKRCEKKDREATQ